MPRRRRAHCTGGGHRPPRWSTVVSVRVLVVEDEAGMARSLQRGLTAEGFTVDVASDGPSGLARARAGGYDAVVLDIMLPGLSGYRVCEALRAEGNDVPVLMLSAKDGEYDQADGLDLGADDYLVKPFAWVVLVARLRALLRRRSTRPARLVVGTLVVDLATREVSVDGTAVALTPREFALLAYLAARSGQVVSKTELLAEVWEGEADDPNVVEVYAGYLRRKMDVPFGRTTLLTVRGAGYRLVSDEA